jgi:hypothetical protein
MNDENLENISQSFIRKYPELKNQIEGIVYSHQSRSNKHYESPSKNYTGEIKYLALIDDLKQMVAEV